MKQLKIKEKVFFYHQMSIQPTLSSQATIYLDLDLNKYPLYKDFFFNLYDSRERFNISTNRIIANDNSISYLDYDTKKSKLSLEIQTDLLIFININERRSDIIDDILNNNED